MVLWGLEAKPLPGSDIEYYMFHPRDPRYVLWFTLADSEDVWICLAKTLAP